MLRGEALESGGVVRVCGEEAQHAARVKRVMEGDVVELLNGAGVVASARVARIVKEGGVWALDARVEGVVRVERALPRVEVWSSAPKGPRLEDMIDGLSQVGCALWRPLLCERTVVDPREGKMSRLERVAVESAKQCAREWIMEIGGAIEFERAIDPAPGRRVLIADGAGEPGVPAGSAEVVVLLVGPEGGFSERELGVAGSIPRVRLGSHTMRIETAAVVGAAMLMGGACREAAR